MSSLDIGDRIRLKFKLKPLDSVTAVLAEISLRIKLPDDSVVDVDNGDIEQETTNAFYYDYLCAQAGKHKFKFTSSGTVDAVEFGVFEVKEGLF